MYPREFVGSLLSCISIRKEKRDREQEVLTSEALLETDEKELEESLRGCHVNLGHPSKELAHAQISQCR